MSISYQVHTHTHKRHFFSSSSFLENDFFARSPVDRTEMHSADTVQQDLSQPPQSREGRGGGRERGRGGGGGGGGREEVPLRPPLLDMKRSVCGGGTSRITCKLSPYCFQYSDTWCTRYTPNQQRTLAKLPPRAPTQKFLLLIADCARESAPKRAKTLHATRTCSD